MIQKPKRPMLVSVNGYGVRIPSPRRYTHQDVIDAAFAIVIVLLVCELMIVVFVL